MAARRIENSPSPLSIHITQFSAELLDRERVISQRDHKISISACRKNKKTERHMFKIEREREREKILISSYPYLARYWPDSRKPRWIIIDREGCCVRTEDRGEACCSCH